MDNWFAPRVGRLEMRNPLASMVLRYATRGVAILRRAQGPVLPVHNFAESGPRAAFYGRASVWTTRADFEAHARARGGEMSDVEADSRPMKRRSRNIAS